MSGEHYALNYLAVVPEDGPWVVVLGPPGDVTHVGPFDDSDEAIRWYWRHGNELPVDIISLVRPEDYPGAQNGEPSPDPQPELPLE